MYDQLIVKKPEPPQLSRRGKRLIPKDSMDAAISMLRNGYTMRETSAKCLISLSTVYRIAKDVK
jgi:hypothetical protein